jgi:hypothetical protein
MPSPATTAVASPVRPKGNHVCLAVILDEDETQAKCFESFTVQQQNAIVTHLSALNATPLNKPYAKPGSFKQGLLYNHHEDGQPVAGGTNDSYNRHPLTWVTASELLRSLAALPELEQRRTGVYRKHEKPADTTVRVSEFMDKLRIMPEKTKVVLAWM